MAEKELVVTLYTPHSGQLQLHNSAARFRVCCSGRRFGKTLACANECAKFALEHQETLTMWVAPTYRQTQIAFRLMIRALRDVLLGPANKSEMRLELLNGSIIQFASAERYDNLRGEGIHFLIMDETAQIDERAWTEALRPTLSDTGGKAIFIGTPRGRNWFWHIFQRGVPGSSSKRPEWESFTFPTASNPYVPRADIEDARMSLPDTAFRQEYEAEFLEESAGVFRNIDGCVEGTVLDPVLEYAYAIGWDVAKHEDFSVVTVINLVTHHVDYFERINRADYIYQIEMVADIANRYHGTVYMDATGNDALLEQVHERGINVVGIKFTNPIKEQYVRNLQVLLERHAITYPYIQVLLDELKQYEYTYSDNRNQIYAAPHGKHDDCVTSLMIAAWLIRDSANIAAALSVASSFFPLPQIVEYEDAVLMKRQIAMQHTFQFLRNPVLSLLPKEASSLDPYSKDN